MEYNNIFVLGLLTFTRATLEVSELARSTACNRERSTPREKVRLSSISYCSSIQKQVICYQKTSDLLHFDYCCENRDE